MRVFLLDDHHDSVEMLAVVLEERLPGPSYDVFYEGTSALSAARRSWPDVVVADLEMPGMTGQEFAKALVSKLQSKKLPVLVAISGNARELAGVSVSRLFDHSFLKPLDIALLVDVIHNVSLSS